VTFVVLSLKGSRQITHSSTFAFLQETPAGLLTSATNKNAKDRLHVQACCNTAPLCDIGVQLSSGQDKSTSLFVEPGFQQQNKIWPTEAN